MEDNKEGLFKVVWTDGYDRENFAEREVVGNLTHAQAMAKCEELRANSRSESDWLVVKRQEAPLWRGMEEFV